MQLYMFDLDGTLIQPHAPKSPRSYDEVELLPRRREVLAGLLGEGRQIAVIANQPSVGFGTWTEAQFEDKLRRALDELGLAPETVTRVCYADPHSRDPRYTDPAECARQKPAGAMLAEALAACGLAAADGTYVGDQPEDEQMARQAGVAFEWASRFFEGR